MEPVVPMVNVTSTARPPGESAMKTSEILYISAEVINGIVSLVGNAIVVAAILKTRSLHTVTNVFIGSLAIADVVVGFIVAPLAVSSFEAFPLGFYPCTFMNCLILMFTNVSILMLLAVAVEKFIAISKPFTYIRLMTVRRAMLINVLVWMLGFILGMVPMYGWNKGLESYKTCGFINVISLEYMVYFQFFGLVLLPLFIMLVIYIYILRIVHHHTSRDSRQNSIFNSERTSKKRRDWKKDMRAIKYYALIIIIFAICWLPVNIFNSVSLFCPSCPAIYEALLAAIVLSHANSSINPFLYAASNSRIKRAIQIILHMKLPLEDIENTDTPRGHRRSSLSQGEEVVHAIIGRSVGNGLFESNMALPYPFHKKDIKPPNGNSNDHAHDTSNIRHTDAPALEQNISQHCTIAWNGQQNDRSPLQLSITKQQNQELQSLNTPPSDMTGNLNVKISTTPLPFASPKRPGSPINGIKHNQVYPAESIVVSSDTQSIKTTNDNGFALDKLVSKDDYISINSCVHFENTTMRKDTAFENLAFVTDDSEICETDHIVIKDDEKAICGKSLQNYSEERESFSVSEPYEVRMTHTTVTDFDSNNRDIDTSYTVFEFGRTNVFNNNHFFTNIFTESTKL